MKRLSVATMLCTCISSMVWACSDDAPEANAAPVAGPSSADASVDAAPSPDASGPTACPLSAGSRTRILGTVRHLDGSASPPALAGVRVCIHGRSDLPCVSSDADGSYEHACVPSGDVAVHFSLAGYASTMWLRVAIAAVDHRLDAVLLTDDQNRTTFAAAGATYPSAGRGLVTVKNTTRLDGITMTAVSAGAEGPFYSADGMTIAKGATTTTGEGVVFFLAPVGSAEIRVEGPGGQRCGQPLGGWGSERGTVTVPVLEGTETDILVECP